VSKATAPGQVKKPEQCAASLAGHQCCLDADSLDHWDRTWDEDTDGPWLLGVAHRCGCDNAIEWPEVR
jgi:hypothetical protein